MSLKYISHDVHRLDSKDPDLHLLDPKDLRHQERYVIQRSSTVLEGPLPLFFQSFEDTLI